MREKLIELVREIRRTTTAWHTAEDIADHLIANGVRIPVHCGQCRFAIDETTDGWMWCKNWNSGTNCGGYCYAGERKDNE